MNESVFYCVVNVHPLSAFVSQLLLTPLNTSFISYKAGQYVNVIHDDHTFSSLSIACAPNQEHQLEFHLFHPKENVLANHLLDLAREQKIWQLTGPFGDCTVGRIQPDKPIIFIARGTGFAPIKAVMEAMFAANGRAIHFYWSMAKSSHFYLLGLLEKWASTIPHFSYALISQDSNVAKPEYLLEQIYQQHPDLSQSQVYASGSPSFVHAVFSGVAAKGLAKEFFYSDVDC